MTEEELVQIVEQVRSQKCELPDVDVKAATGGTPRRLFEPLSAFSNTTGGGVILFGIDERSGFDLVGVGNPHKLQEDISNIASSEMEPPLRPDMTVGNIEGRIIVAAEVGEIQPQQKPCFYRTAGIQKGSYLRVGNTNRRMSDYEIFGYLSGRSQPRDDEEVIEDATPHDLDEDAVSEYLDALRTGRPRLLSDDSAREEVLSQMGVVRRVSGMYHPTLAGLLVFGTYPQSFLPQLCITFVRYYGVTSDELSPRGERFLDNRKFEGRIPEMIKAAHTHVMGSIRHSTLIQGVFSREIPEYPQEAIAEAIRNAVGHRDYSRYVRGSQIRIELFADRLEIISPGGLFGNVTVENLEEEQSTRNALLIRTLEDLHVLDNRGTGIRAMIRAMREAKLGPPVFRDARTSFRVTLRNHTLMSPEIIQWLNRFSGHRMNDHQRVALAYVRASGSMANSDYRRLNHVDTTVATQELREMVDQGLLEQRGTRRWATYSLASGWTAVPETTGVDPMAEGRVLAYVRRHGEITNSRCRQELGITRDQASRLLSRLVHSGRLRRLGKKRWTRYVLPDQGLISI